MATIDYCVIAAYLVIVTGLGVFLRKLAGRNLESYFLGGKRIPWWALAASGAVSNFDITGTMWMVTVLYLLVMPMVLQKYLPIGLKGLVIAGLLSAFMSTFSSTANSGASYVVRDIWQPLFRPHADERHLVRYSYIATICVVLAGIVVGLNAESIRSIWGWIMMALGGAVIMPNVLRWYWWRLNGWGYAAGTLGGIVLSLAVLFFPDMPMYVQFPLISAGSLVACLVVSLATAPAEDETLRKFYRTVRPFGAWGPVRKTCGLSRGELADPAESPWPAVWNTLIACCGVTGMYLFSMYLIGHRYYRAGVWFGVFLCAAAVLYFTWYRWLPDDEALPRENTEPV